MQLLRFCTIVAGAAADDYTNRRLGVPLAAQVAPAFASPYALAVALGDDMMYDK